MIGTARSGSKAPFEDESYEIWGVSSRAKYVTRATRWFELHRLDGEDAEWAGKWREAVKIFIKDTPLYMLYPEPELAKSVIQYPHERITSRFGTYSMSSSFSWMMAMAIDELRPLNGKPIEGKISIYGVDMEYGSEYAQQRAGFHHFMDLARFAGISVSNLVTSGLAYEPVPYPMWQDDPLLNKLDLRISESEGKIKELDTLIRHTRTMIAQNVAIQEALSRYGNDQAPEEIKRLGKEYEDFMDTSAKLSKDIVYWEAVREEQGWTRDYLK